MSQFALPNYPSGPFYQCFAISTSPDPLGSWYRYAYVYSASAMNDFRRSISHEVTSGGSARSARTV